LLWEQSGKYFWEVAPEKLPGNTSGEYVALRKLLITFLYQIFLCQEFLLY